MSPDNICRLGRKCNYFVESTKHHHNYLMGFSMGGAAARMVALNAPSLVQRLVLAGTALSSGPGRVDVDVGPFMKLYKASNDEENEPAIRDSFDYPTISGKAAAKASWQRIRQRNDDRAGLLGEDGAKIQAASWAHWSKPHAEKSYQRLGELKMPVLIANGDKDALIHTANSWGLYQRIPNAKVAIYPGAGHGFLNQYAEEFAKKIDGFLEGEGERMQVRIARSKI